MTVKDISIGEGSPLVLISGPCVVEGDAVMQQTARGLKDMCGELEIPLIFKASYEKDNRTDGVAYRGPGLDQGLKVLTDLRREFGFPVTSDVHRSVDVQAAAEALDLLQVPAFLCRQTSLLEAMGKSGRPINIKKGQFMSPRAMAKAVQKVLAAGGEQVLLTERGTCFGYDRLVCDLTNVPAMQALGYPVVLDAGHAADCFENIPVLARAGVATGADALFIECHHHPSAARCDGGRMLSLRDLERLLKEVDVMGRFAREMRIEERS
jgi:2-dehydro-3-deoxyphosphooctonate aldolase (KDO 8-P synthase)